VFYVIEGAVNLKVHDTTLVLATGAMFIVPRGKPSSPFHQILSINHRLIPICHPGNTYFIENIGDRDAKLFFTQARKVALEEEVEENVISAPMRSNESMPRRVSVGSGGRSSSAAAPSGGGGSGGVGKFKRAMSTKT
jgi:centromere protein C